ncbi:hypothetical protein EV383_6104 [Pseudonocardia sediminis]|uniref:EamA-like transporter family protein n=2 Tax=Pseudonocardia sediminis TaxID=1397368 RepID=A0A4Q7V559_PSEST|nr:hypothetical protein EV383_6104 [Pseudonocardia sediminis]
MAFALVAMVFNSVAAILQADAAGQARRTRAILARPRFIAGLGMDLLAWTCTVLALGYLPVFAVQATLAGSIAMTALYARFYKDEWLRPVHRMGIVASILGLILVASSAGEDRVAPRTGEGGTALVLLGALAALLLISVALRKVSRPWPSAIVAGLGLGGGAVAVRAMHVSEGNVFVGLLTEPLVYVLIGMWATGLYNYARALRLGDVSTVTALFMVTEVVVPGIVGIALLGDTIRDGWYVPMVLGLLLAVYGVSILARRKSEKRTPARVH